MGFEPLPGDHLLKRCPCRRPESWRLFMLIKKMLPNLKHNRLVGNIIWWDLELNRVVVCRVGFAFHLIARRRLHIKTLRLETNIGDYFSSKKDSHWQCRARAWCRRSYQEPHQAGPPSPGSVSGKKTWMRNSIVCVDWPNILRELPLKLLKG